MLKRISNYSTAVAAILFIVFALASESSAQLQSGGTTTTDFMCGQGLNSELNQTAQCTGTPQGQLCPIGQTGCEILTSNSNCPALAPLNPTSNRCEMPLQCASGTYVSDVCADSSCSTKTTVQQCVTQTPPICSASAATFDPSRNVCESSPLCITGSNYDPAANICTGYYPPVCPQNVTFYSSSQMCQADPTCSLGTYNASVNKCQVYDTAQSACPQGTVLDSTGNCSAAPVCTTGTFNTTLNQCVDTEPATCPAGTTLASSTGLCQADPVCPSGSSYSSSADACLAVTTAPPQCPTAMTYDSNTHLCLGSYICPAGTTYDSANKTCDVVPNCPAGMTYSPIQNICSSNTIYAPSCPAGTSFVGGGVNKCQSAPICPSGTTFNSTLLNCQANPSCPSGTYDPVSNTCTLTTTSPPVCPSGSSFVGGSVDKCQANLTCPAGTTFNGTTLKCQATPTCSLGTYDPLQNACVLNTTATGAAICHSGTSLNGSTDKCQASPTCSSGTYDSSQNACVVNTTSTSAAICPSGMSLNGSRDRCESNPSCSSGTYDPSSHLCLATASATCMMTDRTNTFSDLCTGAYDDFAHFYHDNNYCYAEVTSASCCDAMARGSGLIGSNLWCDNCDCLSYAAPTCPSGYSWAGNFSCSKYSAPSCPAGTSMNNSTNVCDTSASCSSGSYDPVQNLCVTNSTTIVSASCPSGTSLNGTTDLCEAVPTCSSGSYDPAQNLCVTNTTQITSAICPSGAPLNGSTDLCEASYACVAGTVYSSADGKCEATPTCTSGSFVPSLDVCQYNGTWTPNCPTGSSLNGADDQCEAAYSCPAGTVYSASSQKCEAVPTCTSGTFDPPTGLCIQNNTAAATCPLGGTLDINLDKCTQTPGCPSGSTWNGAIAECQINPTCSSGSLNILTNLCELDTYTAPTCPAPTHIVYADSKCESMPTCSGSNYFYNVTSKLCVDQSTPTCPTGTSVNSQTHICQSYPQCPPMYVFEHTNNDQCVLNASYPPQCPTGTRLNVQDNKCEVAPTCANGGHFDETLKECVLQTGATCTDPVAETVNAQTSMCQSRPLCNGGTGTFNSAYEACVIESQPTCPSGGYANVITGVCQSIPGCSLGSTLDPNGMCASTGGLTSAAICPPGTQTGPEGCMALPTCAFGLYGNGACHTPPTYTWIPWVHISITGAPQQFGRIIIGNLGHNEDMVFNVNINIDTNGDGAYDSTILSSLTVTNPVFLDDFTINVQLFAQQTYYDDMANAIAQSLAAQHGIATSPVRHYRIASSDGGDSRFPVYGTPNKFDYYGRSASIGSPLGAPPSCIFTSWLSMPVGFSGWCDPSQIPGPETPYFCTYEPWTTDLEGNQVCGELTVSYGQYFEQMGPQLCTVAQRTSGYSYVSSNFDCEAPAQCPSGTTLDSSKTYCVATPTCADGSMVYDVSLNECISYRQVCPLDNGTTTYTCMDNGKANLQCSPNTCVDIGSTPPTLTDPDLTEFVNDGAIDPTTGACLGQIYVFNGHPGQCKTPGLQTNDQDCCNIDNYNPIYNRYAMICPTTERIVALNINKNQAHYVGRYCTDEWRYIGCVQYARTYCYYGSLLARIIAEQGRVQLHQFSSYATCLSPNTIPPGPPCPVGSFYNTTTQGCDNLCGDWEITGDPKHLNCRGFTPAEFQNLDFSKLDLSEFLSFVQQQAAANLNNVQNGAMTNMQNFYNNLQH